MRFEDFVREDQIRILNKLHRRLNQRLFNGTLNKVEIDITLLREEWAQFRIREEREVIEVSGELVSFLEDLDFQRDQVSALTNVIFPVMISQYCYEKALSDQEWKKDEGLREKALKATEGFCLK